MTADNENGHCNRVVSKSKPNPPPEMANSTIDDKCPSSYCMEIVWRNIFLMIILHVASVYGGYLGIFHARYRTVMFNYLYLILTGLGITAGAHRLWAHRSYEATTTLRIILMLFNCGALQNDILEWSRDHRVHHKFSETDADPHNSRRGFFFAHIGWLLCRKHPEVKNKGRTVSLKDIADDPVVQFQRRYYKPLATLFTFILPSIIPCACWNEDPIISIFASMTRYTLLLHATWLVNSAAHLWGNRPYDNGIQPVECKLVEIVALGEGYHNYHHIFPFDYSASEMTWLNDINFTTMTIDFLSWLGMVKNRKKVDHQTVAKRVQRTGNIQLYGLYQQQHQRSWWRHTPLTIMFMLFSPILALYIYRRFISYLYYLYFHIENRWP
ncbi:Calcium/calmodulin-dependent protein kinase type 1 [Dermatophagoides farinae]|uniref:Calcium/calmodulin-dependent protein kinase type 1 n=1 Tax=Dermatophagoides farinae TaxID=6954 RepID=A0A922LD98_DERFA|nr:Calcium/calmodulin-dependent protein kinase type 1 [Dermatophagoides farinae]